jgi:Cft2 family RNA processing exonuclease
LLKKYNQNTLEKKKLQRACLSHFFNKHIQIAKTKFCEECGEKLKGDVSEIAHRLPKSHFKSIQCDDENVVFLCGYRSNNNCHSKYDGSNEQLQSLNIFAEEKLKVEKLLEKVTEKYNWKLIDRWKI